MRRKACCFTLLILILELINYVNVYDVQASSFYCVSSLAAFVRDLILFVPWLMKRISKPSFRMCVDVRAMGDQAEYMRVK